MADTYLKLEDARAILLRDIPEMMDERFVLEREYTREMHEASARTVVSEIRGEIRQVREMFEADTAIH